MGGKRRDRHRWKELSYSLERELQTDYGLSLIESRALVQRIAEFIDQVFGDHDDLRGPGQIRYVAVAEGQPAGRPVAQCLTISVLLTLLVAEDASILIEQGSVALRKARLYRLAREARNQGAVLSYEDLSLILSVDVTTVRRLVGELRKQGLETPTRGLVMDIGPGTSHKKRVIELLFRGMQPAAIAAYTSHSLASVERYITDFARIVELTDRGYSKQSIVRITSLSPKTVRDYLQLKERYSDPQHRFVMDIILQRFWPIVPGKED